jgi:site-specific DNA-methyltransferase (adenine-specific)
MEVIQVDVKNITPYEKNPRKIDQNAIDKVANSIKGFGFQQPIVLDENYVIIVGHTRILAAKKLGLKEVPCVVAKGLSDEQVKAYRLADNKTGELSAWDFDLLTEEIDSIFDLDMSAFGFAESFNEDIEDFFQNSEEEAKKEPKKIQCPHCKEWFEVE